MNDLHHACESWSERISLAAAGCLPVDEETELQRHLATCPACRERYRQLAGLCGALTDMREPSRGVEKLVVQRVMAAIAPAKPLHRGVRPAWLWAAATAMAASLVLVMVLRWSEVKQPRQPAHEGNVARSPDAAPKAVAPRVLAAVGPTMLDFDWAIARSDDAPERILSQDARRIGVLFDQTRTPSLKKNDVELSP